MKRNRRQKSVDRLNGIKENHQPIITVFYVNIGNLAPEDISEYMSKMASSVKEGVDDYPRVDYLIPVRTTESRVEVLNPRVVSNEEFNEIQSKMDEVQKSVTDFIDDLKNSNGAHNRFYPDNVENSENSGPSTR